MPDHGLPLLNVYIFIPIQAKCSGVELTLLCSHLESTKQHSKERMNQLKIAMDHMKKAPATSTVVFGGDCNLRDTEVSLYDVSPHERL